MILHGTTELGLDNLRAQVCNPVPPPSPADQAQMVKAHFEAGLASLQGPQHIPQRWAEAKEKVLVQLMPRQFTSQAGGLAWKPFVPGVAVGVVIDLGPSYTYVREEDRRRWEVAPEQLFEQAVRNLEAFSRHVRMEGRGGEGDFLGVEEKDGYDAARILLPGFRETAAHILGDPFLAAIPNRDFLFMFRAGDGPVDAQVRRQAEKDYAAQDHPLTPRILRVWKDGRVEEAR